MKIKKPGLRILKTGIAVFLCFIIGKIRGEMALPFYSAIASVICIKNDYEDTKDTGISRVKGTVIGGFLGFIHLTIKEYINFNPYIEYIIYSFSIMLLIWIVVNINSPKSGTIAPITYISVAVNHASDGNAYLFAIERTMDTLIGVLVSMVVNRFWLKGEKNEIKWFIKK